MSKKIAITGGIGSGKSSVVNVLREMGYSVFSCDEIYADLRESKEYLQKLSTVFPQAVVDGRLDRKRLSEIVFQNPEKREVLNELSHPMIMQKLNALINERREPLVFAEVPLLFENGFEKDFDAVIVVKRNIDERITAILERDGLTDRQARQRINAQFDYDAPQNQNYLQSIHAYIIENDGAKMDLTKKTKDILKKL
ncbi:MAG: dephospho-CoA kinase [Clostridia bacterium]|nr:dephospho-CoA kinase [Clostridia bacterium]